jgi:hypothetical protein
MQNSSNSSNNNRPLCTAKEMITRERTQPTNQEKISVSYSSDRGLICRTWKELKN